MMFVPDDVADDHVGAWAGRCCVELFALGSMAERLCANPFGRDFHSTSHTIARKAEIALSVELKRNDFTDYGCSIPTLTWRQHLRAATLVPFDAEPTTRAVSQPPPSQ